jgi:DNA-binding winged helix-turn-helix (wHTH) protein
VFHRFGSYALNTSTRQVMKGDSELHLSPKAFDLLVLLIENRSRALSKAELQELLWPSTFVGETNLATLVAEIRRALQDSAQQPEFVRTVHRFGYRFVATISGAPASADTTEEADTQMHLATADHIYRLAPGSAVIGRANDATIRVDSGGVSRHHARITVTGNEAQIEDLGSKNGTFVDGQPVTGPCRLTDGNEVRVGPVAFTFKVTSPSLATETMRG